MKTKHIITSLLFLFILNFSFGQISFKTGDSELEAELNIINSDALKDLAKFKESAAKELAVTKEKIQELLDKAMKPAEIILSGRISTIAKVPLDNVVKSYEKNKDKGWGQVAKDLGIKPGSPEFHALKGKAKKGNSGINGNGNSGKGKGKGKG